MKAGRDMGLVKRAVKGPVVLKETVLRVQEFTSKLEERYNQK